MIIPNYLTPVFVEEIAKPVSKINELSTSKHSFILYKQEIAKRVFEHLELQDSLQNRAKYFSIDGRLSRGYEIFHRGPSILASLSDVLYIPNFAHIIIEGSYTIANVFGSMRYFDSRMQSHGQYFGYDNRVGQFCFQQAPHLNIFKNKSVSVRFVNGNSTPVLLSNDKNDMCLSHWLWSKIPTLLSASDFITQLKNPVFISSYELTNWQIESLSLYSPELAHIPRIVVDKMSILERLISIYDPEHWLLDSKFIRATQLLRDKLKCNESEYPERVYLSRNDAATRRIINETEVVKVLSEFGFIRFLMTEIPFPEQVELLQRAKAVIFIAGSHGALTPFLSQDAFIVEITNGSCPELLNGWQLLTSNLGINSFHSLNAQPSTSKAQSQPPSFNDDLILDTNILRSFLLEHKKYFE